MKEQKLSTAKLISLSSLRAPYDYAKPARTLCQACGRWDGAPSLHQDVEGWTGEIVLLFGQRVNEEELAYLQKTLHAAGISESATLIVDAVRCVGKSPTMKQIRACRPFLVGLVAEHKPRYILAFGSVALRASTNDGKLKKITPIRGKEYVFHGLETQDTKVYGTYTLSEITSNHALGPRLKEDLLRCTPRGLPRLEAPKRGLPRSHYAGVDTEFMPDGRVVTISAADRVSAVAHDVTNRTGVTGILRRLSNAAGLVGHNLAVDLDSVARLTREFNLPLRKMEKWLQGKDIEDSLVLSRMVDENRGKGAYSLETLLRSNHHAPQWKESGTEIDVTNPLSWDAEYRVERCRLDGWAPVVLCDELREHARGPIELTHRITQTLRRIYHAGARIDDEYFKTLARGFSRDAAKAKQTLTILAAKMGFTEFSPTNDNHLRDILFNRYKLKAEEFTKSTALPSVNKTFLKKYKDHEFVKALLEFNLHDKRSSTYGGGLASKFSISPDGYPVLRFRINPLGARTGRRSSEKPNAQNWPKDVRRIIVSRFNDGAIADNDYCFAPQTKILCSDLTWKRADEIKVGQEIIAFPEHGIKRKYQRANVVGTKRLCKPTVRVVTSRGCTTVSDDHMFLAQNGAEKHYRWVQAKDLKEGARIPFLTQPWEIDRSYGAAYLAGIYDGEGWVSGGNVGFAQNEGPVLDKVESLLQERGFKTTVYGRGKLKMLQHGDCLGDRLRFLGSVRPERLLDKHAQLWENKACASKHSRVAVVHEVQAVDTAGEVIAIETTSKTLIADGFFSHNCKLEVILFAYTAKEWKLLEFFQGPNGYIAVGKELFGTTVKEDTDQYRTIKSIVLGIQYGMGAYKLAYQLWNVVGVKLSSDWEEHVEKASQLRNKYLSKFPGIKRYMWNQKQTLLRKHCVSSLTGRVRHLPCPYGEETPGFGHLLNQAINFPIQSLASDVTGTAMVDLEASLLSKYRLTYEEYHWRLMTGKPPAMPLLINEVHDDLVFDIPPKGRKENLELIRTIMAKVPTLRTLCPEFTVELSVGQKVGSRWGLDDVS